MNDRTFDHEIEEEAGLPIEPIAFLLRFWQKKILLIVGCVISVLLAGASGLLLGKRVYESETVLLFTSNEGTLAGGVFRIPTLATYLSMVKLQSNLARVRRVLGLGADLATLDKSAKVDIQRRTSLLSIRVRWDDPSVAAGIANELRESFLESTVTLRNGQARHAAEQLARRIVGVNENLEIAEKRLESFCTANAVVDLDRQAQWLLEAMTATDLQYENAQIERRSVELQLGDLQKIMDSLKTQMEREKADVRQLEGIREAKLRSDRLRELIDADRKARSNAATLGAQTAEFERLEKLHARKLVSDNELQMARSRLEAQRAVVIDTKQIKAWKVELEKLDAITVPNTESELPTAPILRDLLLRSFDLKLKNASLAEKVTHLKGAVAKYRKSLDELPAAQKQWLSLRRNLAALEREREELERQQTGAFRLANSDTPDFALVSKAAPSVRPVKSTRKIIAVAVAIAGFGFCFAVVLVLVVVDRTIQSGGEARHHLGTPVLVEVPRCPGRSVPEPGEADPEFIEEVKVAARELRKRIDKKGARILLASAMPGAGTSSLAANLAVCMGRQDQRILVIDAHVRGEHRSPLARHIELEGHETRGLGDYLSFRCDRWDEAVWPTRFVGVEYMPSAVEGVVPDLLVSQRMRLMLEEVSERYAIILIDGPAVLPTADAQMLAEGCDGVVLVVRAGATSISLAKKARERLASAASVLGLGVSAVHPLFAERGLG